MAGFTNNLNVIARCTQTQRSIALKSMGLCGGQVPYILRIARVPGLTGEELAREMCVNKSTAARKLSALEKNGMIVRRARENDRRCQAIFLTEKAEAMIPEIRSVVRGWNAYLLEDFTDEERERILEVMERVASRAREYIGNVPEEAEP